jgi:hypothetical protein
MSNLTKQEIRILQACDDERYYGGFMQNIVEGVNGAMNEQTANEIVQGLEQRGIVACSDDGYGNDCVSLTSLGL